MDAKTKRDARLRRHTRVRKKISGNTQRPRLAVFRSNRHIYAQLIDDVNAVTVAQASDTEVKGKGPTERAKAVGELHRHPGEGRRDRRGRVRPRRPLVPRPCGRARRWRA